jgi:hypothetical protein
MPTVFFNPKDFALVNLLPQRISFTVAYFAYNVIMPLANRHAQQWGDMARHKLHLYFDNSKCHTARHVQEEMASHRCVPVPHLPYSPDLAIVHLYLFGRSRQEQFSGRTLDGEQNTLEAVTEALSRIPKDDVKSTFLHWRERGKRVADHNQELYPN